MKITYLNGHLIGKSVDIPMDIISDPRYMVPNDLNKFQ
jgi:hypothetical protein